MRRGKLPFPKEGIPCYNTPMRPRILLFGDSNTWGYDPACVPGFHYAPGISYADRCAGALSGKAEILADGLNGRTVPAKRFTEKYLRGMIEKYLPLDVFAVMLGTNNILLSSEPDARKCAARMAAFLAAVKALRDEEDPFRILLIAPPLPFSGMCGEEEAETALIRRQKEEAAALPALYREAAETLGGEAAKIRFLDAARWEIPLSFDGIHFSEEGHRLFAEKLCTVLRELLDL